LFQEQFIELYNNEGVAAWGQHKRKNQLDIAVLNLRPVVGRFHMLGVNEVATQDDMEIEVGNEVFILGYPLGFTHFINTPIWKRGSIASEPHVETADLNARVVIDATTRQGMSGAPVVMRAKTHYVTESGVVKCHVNASRFLGVYASRPNIAPAGDEVDEDRRAEIGFFYKSGCVEEVIRDGIKGPNYGVLP
jgi:hypothetical protein